MSQRVLIPELIGDQPHPARAFLQRLAAAQRETNDWTDDDDTELAFYADRKCYYDLSTGVHKQVRPSVHPLHFCIKKYGPQYLTKAAMLFLDVLYPSHRSLVVFHQWIDTFGYARAAPGGISTAKKGRRPATPGWASRHRKKKGQAVTATALDSDDDEVSSISDDSNGDEYAPVTGSRAGRNIGAQSRDNTTFAVPCASEAVATMDMTLRSSVDPKKASHKRSIGSSASAAHDGQSDLSDSSVGPISRRTRMRLAPPAGRLSGRPDEAATPSRLDSTAAALGTPIPEPISSVSSLTVSPAPSPVTVESNLDFVARFEADAAALVQRLEDWDKSNQNIAVARQNISTNSNEDAAEIVPSMRSVHDSVKSILNNTMEAVVAKVDASCRWVESVELLLSQGYKVTFTGSTPPQPGA